MRLQVRIFLTSKHGCAPEECEDAIAIDLDSRSFAVADGATEAFASGQWAQHLAHKWVLSEVRPLEAFDFRAWVEAQGQIWHEKWQEKKLPWYAEAKERDGSFAAFVALKLDKGHKPSWRALALGDACLFRCEGDKLLKALPLDDPAQFNTAPPLVASRPEKHEAAFGKMVTASGELRAGDVFWLASDSAAAWLLRLWANPDERLERLVNLLKEKRYNELTELIEHQRQAGQMRDDDVAIARIEILSSQ